MRRLPWVGLPTDSTVLGHHRFAVAGEKYVRALGEELLQLPATVQPCARCGFLAFAVLLGLLLAHLQLVPLLCADVAAAQMIMEQAADEAAIVLIAAGLLDSRAQRFATALQLEVSVLLRPAS